MAAEQDLEASDLSFYNEENLSDVKIKFSGQQLFGHKCILARKSKYFHRAFCGGFPVALADEIDLGDDEEPEAIRAMIRHIYGLPYGNTIKEKSEDDNASASVKADLIFLVHLFIAADKYDVPSLRPLVVEEFEDLMHTNWKGDQFIPSMQMLCGPSAGHLADNSLQVAAASFCADHLDRLLKHDSFAAMIRKEEPFAGQLLTRFANRTNGITLYACDACKSISDEFLEEEDSRYQCFNCTKGRSFRDIGPYTAVMKAYPL